MVERGHSQDRTGWLADGEGESVFRAGRTVHCQLVAVELGGGGKWTMDETEKKPKSTLLDRGGGGGGKLENL